LKLAAMQAQGRLEVYGSVSFNALSESVGVKVLVVIPKFYVSVHVISLLNLFTGNAGA
jgi:hypothetical protein